ncbi:MAG TPA: hypothetical protein VGO98_01875 [Candidatus Saccharimonadales bacterium]|jgi:hypothetical protein|nr:hypothetical protein [Candidatus Saccharimonadales bacterium]
MIERLIVQISEIILAIAALFGIVIVLSAAWHDLYVIARKKRLTTLDSDPAATHLHITPNQTIRSLPHLFFALTRNMITKALVWRKPHDISTKLSGQSRMAIVAISSVGLVIMIAIWTYFFYTAAILQSNTLLTLSWAVVSLWLVAVVWSDDDLVFSRKCELTFTIPFMYFVFYVQSLIQLTLNMWRLATIIKLPKIQVQKISDAIRVELYSTRY